MHDGGFSGGGHHDAGSFGGGHHDAGSFGGGHHGGGHHGGEPLGGGHQSHHHGRHHLAGDQDVPGYVGYDPRRHRAEAMASRGSIHGPAARPVRLAFMVVFSLMFVFTIVMIGIIAAHVL
jgi:hypothetical protein